MIGMMALSKSILSRDLGISITAQSSDTPGDQEWAGLGSNQTDIGIYAEMREPFLTRTSGLDDI